MGVHPVRHARVELGGPSALPERGGRRERERGGREMDGEDKEQSQGVLEWEKIDFVGGGLKCWGLDWEWILIEGRGGQERRRGGEETEIESGIRAGIGCRMETNGKILKEGR
jgi:hypothetical protein